MMSASLREAMGLSRFREVRDYTRRPTRTPAQLRKWVRSHAESHPTVAGAFSLSAAVARKALGKNYRSILASVDCTVAERTWRHAEDGPTFSMAHDIPWLLDERASIKPQGEGSRRAIDCTTDGRIEVVKELLVNLEGIRMIARGESDNASDVWIATEALRLGHDVGNNDLLVVEGYDSRRRDSDRLYTAFGPGLQRLSKKGKALAFYDLGYVDIDIDAAHQVIIQDAAHEDGLETPVLDRLVADKTAVREQLASELGVTISTVKTLLLALTYGATVTRHKGRSIYQLAKHESPTNAAVVVDAIKDNATITAYAEELKAVRKAMYPDLTAAGQRSAMSHYCQSVERMCIDHLHSEFGDDLLVFVHDGIVVRADPDTLDIHAIAQRMSKEVFGCEDVAHLSMVAFNKVDF